MKGRALQLRGRGGRAFRNEGGRWKGTFQFERDGGVKARKKKRQGFQKLGRRWKGIFQFEREGVARLMRSRQGIEKLGMEMERQFAS